jgi:competence protein ComEA
MRKLNTTHLLGYVIVAALSAAVTAAGLTLSGRTQPAPIIIEPPAPTNTPVPTPTPGPIRVHVSGAVAQPDVYALPPGSIMEAAVEAAGGLAADAGPINLAAPLRDGMQVHVPTRAEVSATPPPLSGPEPAGTASGDDGAAALVDINAASGAELETLPGIGPSTAQKIIDYREENGRFPTIDAIMEVSGIGPATFADLEPLITVGE